MLLLESCAIKTRLITEPGWMEFAGDSNHSKREVNLFSENHVKGSPPPER
jgi:hypothetical protein